MKEKLATLFPTGYQILLVLAALAFVLAACAGPAATPTTPAEGTEAAHGGEIGGYVELVDVLRQAGASVEPQGAVQQEFFPVGAQVIQVDGQDVQVFEFADPEAQQAAAAQISPDGSTIGTTMVTWVEPPHFWAKGRVIVLYVGSDAGTIDLLGQVLGEQIAGS